VDDITLLLVLEARDKATQILDTITKRVNGYGDATKAASAQASRSATEIEAANTRAAAASASYDRATKASAEAQAGLKDAMLASKAAQLEAAAAAREGSASVAAAQKLVTESADAEEAALVRVQKAEQLAATRSKELAEAQAATAASVEKGGSALKTAGVAAGATAIAVGYIGVKSIEAAADYQSSTTRLVTSAGEQQSALDSVRQGMLQMAGQVGYSTDALSTAMYKVESGGQHGAAGLEVLRAAAEGAKTENANLETVADAVTSALVDYHLKASDAATVTSKMVAATSAGKTTFEQLSASFSAILPVASAAHVSLDDILGDLASMTVHGMSAQQASQNLADTIRHMQNPTAVQSKELALLGMTTTQLADDLKTKGLSGTLNDISNHVMKLIPPGSDKVIGNLKTALNGLNPAVRELAMHLFDGSMTAKQYSQAAQALDPISAKQALSFGTLAGSMHRIGDQQMTGAQVMQTYGAALAKATGDATGLNTMLMLSGENAGVTAGAIKTVSSATAEAGNHVKGWSEIQGTFNQKLAQAKGSLEAAKISIGTGLLPAVTALAGGIVKVITPVASWMAKHQSLSAIILGSIGILAVLVVAIWAINTALAAMTAIPVVAIIVGIVAAVAALVAGVIYAYNHWGWFKTAVLDTWNAIKVAALFVWHDVLEPAFKGIAAVATWLWANVLKPVFEGAVALWRDVLAPVVMWLWHNIIEPAFKGIQIEIQVAWAVIRTIFEFISAVVRDVLAPVFLWLWHNVIEPVWQGIQIAVSIAWALIQVIWGLMQIEIKILAAIFTWLWHEVLEPVWQGISAVISWAWNNIIKPLWAGMKIELRLLGDAFTWLWHNLIEPVWNGIRDTITAVWNNGIRPVFNFFKDIIKNDVAPAFSAGVSAIAAAWNGVLEVAKAPVRFVVNTVLNDGLLGAYNWIASKFGVKPDNVHVSLPAGFAAGGRIPGADSHADNMLAMVATGEHIMPTARTRKWLPILESIRLHDRLPLYPGDGAGLRGYADGGVVGALKGAASGLWDLFTDPAKLVKGPINALINSIPGAGIVRDMVSGGAHRLLDGLIHWITGTGGGNAGSAMTFLKGQVGKPYIWDSAGPDGYDCSGLVSAVYLAAQGKNPFNHLFSTSDEARYFPIGGPGGILTAGWTNPGESGPGGNSVGHTAGVLMGMPFESAGGVGVRIGSGVTPVSAFAHVGHFDHGGALYPGWNAIYNGTHGVEHVADPNRPAGGGTVVFDLRGSQVMSDRDMDLLIDKIDRRLVRTMLPAAGVQVRR